MHRSFLLLILLATGSLIAVREKIIIITDPGSDDALALTLALLDPTLDVQAIITSYGNSTVQNSTNNAAYIRNLVGAHQVPIYSGPSEPLVRTWHTNNFWGRYGFNGIHSQSVPLSSDAIPRMLEIIQKYSHDITLVSLAPLTTAAQAIKKDPITMQLVKKMIIMGGAIGVAGNISAVAEFNIYTDPEAAQTVLSFPIKKVVIPLDTNSSLPTDFFTKMANTPLRTLMERLFEPCITQKRVAGCLYDALAILLLAKPGAVMHSYQSHVAIETEGRLTRGMMVADRRTFSPESPNATIIDQIDYAVFQQYCISTVNSFKTRE